MPLKYEVILEAGVEGGGVVLLGLAKRKGWLFTMQLDDSTPQLVDGNGSGIHHQTGFVDSWPAALELIKRYQWETFSPITIHPEFRHLVYEAYVDRFKSRGIDVKEYKGKWEQKCLNTSDEIVYREQSLEDLKRAVK